MADTVELMRKRVLDMAIRGELVEQRKEEGPASNVLLENNKILRGNDIPFDIPKNWEWVTLNEIGTWGAGATPARGNPAYWTNGTIPWIKTGELNNGEIWNSEEFITELALEKTSVKVNQPEDILIAMYGATIGKLGILKFEATTNQACCACTPFEGMNNKYLFYFLMSHKEKFIEGSEGGAQPNISKTKIINTPFPLPPTQEQNRIVAKIEEIFAVIDQIGTKKEEALFIIRNMRQTALQDAIMGVLVEQDENDEPASVLYEKIQTEKEQMVKEKKMKKEKPLPAVEEDEIPFEIPESWKWVRLGNIILSIFGGGTPSKAITSYWNGDIPWATVKDISDRDTQLYSTIDFITEDGFNNCSGQMVSKGDIIIITRMGLGRAVISCIDTAINQDLKGIKLPKQLNSKYFLNAYKSISIKGTGTTVKGIKQSSLLNACIPLPPLNEQNRIVEKLDEILAICDQMEAILDGSADMVAERIY